MSKNIVYCADGTWNSSTQDANQDGVPDQTNVCKLFLALSGTLDRSTLIDQGELEKTCIDANGKVVQVAKYIHGVGDSKNPLMRVIGGATGSGTITRIVRGYTYISRMYEAGDTIFIIGFSRGAYTARALAGMIVDQGLLKKISYTSKESREKAYMKAAQVWYRHNSSRKEQGYLEKLAAAVAYLPAFVSHNDIADSDLVNVDQIKAVGVWDTVGAMGVPEVFGDGEKRDAFKFADTKLSSKVQRGIHGVALDERRAPFIPTLWEPAKNVIQLLFPGAHSDVGGGYPEHQLSDISLCWMIDQLKMSGLNVESFSADPKPAGIAHEPWSNKMYSGKQKSRNFDKKYVQEHESIQQRVDTLAGYDPKNRPL